MKNIQRILSLTAIALAIGSAPAFAANNADCDTVQGFAGVPGRDLWPGNCPTEPRKPLSREQVQAERADAERRGEIVAGQGYTQRELSNGTIGAPAANSRTAQQADYERVAIRNAE